MSVARVTEISAISPESFEAAINEGITRATSTLRGVQGAWIKDMNVVLEDGRISGYQVHLALTFVLEESPEATAEGGTTTAQSEVPMGTTTSDTAPGTTVSDIPPGGSGGGVPPDTSRTEGEPRR